MMARAVWTPLAEDDLEEILFQIRVVDGRPLTARRNGEGIQEAVNTKAALHIPGQVHPAAPALPLLAEAPLVEEAIAVVVLAIQTDLRPGLQRGAHLELPLETERDLHPAGSHTAHESPQVLADRLREELSVTPAPFLLRVDRRPNELESIAFGGAALVFLFLAAGLYGATGRAT